jgi:uncharacterized HhH-GPD family protein
MAVAAPDRLYFTESDEANELIAHDPLALLIGFALDQQVTVQSAFSGPLKIKDRLGTLDAGDIASTDPDRLEEVFRQRPAIHRFPGAMATRVRELAAHVEGEYGGDAARLWREAGDSAEALSGVLLKRFGVQAAADLVPGHPTLGDVDSPEALDQYQAAKRAHKAAMRAKTP